MLLSIVYWHMVSYRCFDLRKLVMQSVWSQFVNNHWLEVMWAYSLIWLIRGNVTLFTNLIGCRSCDSIHYSDWVEVVWPHSLIWLVGGHVTRCICYASTECLTSFTNLETLEETEWYYCARCKSRQPSTKRLSLHTLPNVGDLLPVVYVCVWTIIDQYLPEK